jgi:L-lactate dehydrogenase complex protein LldG
MSARAEILADVRRALGVTGAEAPRRRAVEERLEHTPQGVIPARGQLNLAERKGLFRAEAERVFASVAEVASDADVAGEAASYLSSRNLPAILRIGADPYLAALPWQGLELGGGEATAALSRAFGAVAESGTLVLVSGEDNPTSLNFLPHTHIVVVAADDIVGDYEAIWQRLRGAYGRRAMPRSVNLITGPSRSADIGRTMQLGAHGPRELHVIIVGER